MSGSFHSDASGKESEENWEPYMIDIIVRHPFRMTMSIATMQAQIAPMRRNIAPNIVRLSGGM